MSRGHAEIGAPELENNGRGDGNDVPVEVEDRTYRPHITVVRRANRFETQRLAQPALVEWSAFELVESVPEPGGVRYHPLKQ